MGKPRQLRLWMDPDPPLRTRISRWAEEQEIELIFFDPPETFDPAILGVIHGAGQELAVLYDGAQVIQAMVASGMSPEEAIEWFEFNTLGAYVGEATPRFLIRPWDDHVADTEEETPDVEAP